MESVQASVILRMRAKLDKPAKKLVKVKVVSSDSFGPAALPEGYSEYLASKHQKKTYKIPVSIHEGKRKLEESKDYVASSNKKQNKSKTAIRAAGGEVWEDPTMAFWDENDYRMFVGNLGKEVSDEMLSKAFSQYASLQRTHIVRDKKSGVTRGYGFLSFSDPDEFTAALRDMQGKYVGNRPIMIKRSTWKDRMGNEETIAKQKELAGTSIPNMN